MRRAGDAGIPCAAATRQLLTATRAAFTAPASVDDVAARFRNSKKNKGRVEELLDTLVSLGRARELENGRFLAA
ncbi:MAG TPA: hypothetical protein VF175_19765 [Lacipirellula sp.]